MISFSLSFFNTQLELDIFFKPIFNLQKPKKKKKKPQEFSQCGDELRAI